MVELRDAVAKVQFDEHFAEAARALARSVTTTRPPPSGGGSWSDEDLDDVIYDTVARVTPDKLVLAASQAANEKAFRGYFRRALRSTLDIRARGTTEGRVIRAMDDALGTDTKRFCLEGGHWRLTNDEREAQWSEGLGRLIDIAQTVETTMVRMARESRKTPPMAYRRDVRSVCAAVLAVSGPLPKPQLAEVLAYKFNVAFESTFGYLDEDPAAGTDVAVSEQLDPSELAEDRLAAEWMLGQLTGDERLALGAVLEGGSIRGVAELLGCSKHRATLVHERIEAKLKRLASLVEGDARGAITLLMDICRTEAQVAAFSEAEDP